MKFDLVRWTRKDDKSPRTYVAHCSPGESGVCVFRARIDGDTQLLTMSLHNVEGKEIYKVDLEPQS